jgi:hypothetical protein
MDIITQLSQKYKSSDGYVFTSFDPEYIIVMKKYDYSAYSLLSKLLNYDIINNIKQYMLYTYTDENEKSLDIKNSIYAKFYGDKFLVIDIVNKFDNTTKNSFRVIWSRFSYKYKKGKIIPHFNRKKNEFQFLPFGIKFFKIIEPAFFNNIVPNKYNGQYKMWHENGQLKKKYNGAVAKLFSYIFYIFI